MAPVIDLLANIDPTKTQWAFKVRVVRLWENPTFENDADIYSLEMIFVDREGTRIHASVKRNLIKIFKPKLCEGILYLMCDFVIGYNNSKYKASYHKYKLNFMMKTYVKEVEDSSFPYQIYDFIPFRDLLSASETDENKLIDVIGEVVGKDAVQSKEISGRSTKMVDIVLQDIENNWLSCTIWGEHADEISNILDTDNQGPAILLLQMCRPKKFRGEVRICNTYHVTKLSVKAQLEEVQAFRDKLLIGNENLTQRISQISSSSIYDVSDDLSSGGCEVKSIEQLLDSTEAGNCWIYATIVAVESDRNWCYLSCKKCPKKIIPVGTRFHCEKCDSFSADGILRYKIQLRVIDGTGSASIMMWDRECIQLLGKTPTNLNEDMVKSSEYLSYPNEIEALVDKKILFKVQIRHQNIEQHSDVFTVMRLTFDDALISKYITIPNAESQGSDLFLKSNKIVSDDFKDCTSENEVNTPTKKPLSLDELETSSNTKRRLDITSSTKMSTNKNRRVIKQEKP